MVRTILSSIFRAGVALRNAAYDHGVFRVHRMPVPVISVGNISVGGTGKTPLVQHIAEHALGAHRVALVTRGYRRSTSGTFVVSDGRGAVADAASSGDEPAMLARRLPSLVVIADERRVRGCRLAIERFGADLILLDDAYQHRACGRDVDIVLVDASRKPARDRLLPIGRLREPMENLARASLVVLSRCTDEGACAESLNVVRQHTGAPVFRTRFVVDGIGRLGEKTVLPSNALIGQPLATFCGIGSPESFRDTLRDIGVSSVDHADYPDHHAYTIDDVRELVRRADACGAGGFLTTEKDAVRLEPLFREFGGRSVYSTRMRVDFLDDEREFFGMIERRCVHESKA
jgi:tetraacyldisaccharide 4'-kinase